VKEAHLVADGLADWLAGWLGLLLRGS